MNEEFPNTILVDGSAIVLAKVGDSIRIVGSELTPRMITSFEIICHDCEKPQKRKQLTLKLMTILYLCQSCNKSGSRNPFYGKSHSNEFKKRLSEERKGVWGVGEANPMYGVNVWEKVSPKKRELMREKNRVHTANREDNPFRNIREFLGKERWQEREDKRLASIKNRTPEENLKYSEVVSAAQKRLQAKDPEAYRIMRQKAGIISTQRKPYAQNKLEKNVQAWLESKGIDFTYSAIMGDGIHNYQFDFIVHGKRTLIEVHGTYWHSDPRVYAGKDLNVTQIQNKERDIRKADFAKSKGFTLLVIWESDVKANNFAALEELL